MSFDQERAVVGEVVKHLQENAYTIVRVSDGEEYLEQDELDEALENNNLEPILEWTSQAESGSIQFKSAEGDRFTIHMIYGNSTEEVIYDMSASNEAALTAGSQLVDARIEDLEENMGAGPSM